MTLRRGGAPAPTAREERRATFLAEVSRVLASSLDYRATLDAIVQLAVPAIADWCGVDVRQPDGSIRRLAVAHADPRKRRLLEELAARHPSHPDSDEGVPQVIRTGRPALYPEIPDELLRAVARDPDHLAFLREVGLVSAMVVPLVARGQTLGALWFGSAESGQRFDAASLAFAEELAQRAGIAVDNARLYAQSEARRRAAEVLAEVSALLTQTLAPEIVAQRIAEGVRTLLDAQLSVVYRLEPTTGDFEVIGLAGGLQDAFAPGLVVPRGLGAASLVVQEGRPVLIADVLSDARLTLDDEIRARVARIGYRAALGVPLVLRGRVIGVLGLGDRAGRVFSDEDARLAQTFADHAAVALDNARAYRDEQQARTRAEAAERRASFLAHASNLLAASLDIDTTLARLARLAVPVLSDLCVISMVTEDGGIRRVTMAHVDPEKEALARTLDRFPIDPQSAHPVATVVRTGRSMFVRTVTPETFDARTYDPEYRALAETLDYASFIIAPLIARGRTLGAVSLVSAAAGRYEDSDVAVAEDLAMRAAMAIDNARLFGESERQRHEAEGLADLGRLLTETLDPEAVGRRIVDSVARLLAAKMSGLYRLDARTGDFVLLAGHGPGVVWNQVLVSGTGSPALALRERRPVVSRDVLHDPRIAFSPEARTRMEHSGYASIVTVPLLLHDEVIGTLTVGDVAGRRFTREEIRLLERFADQAAVALENARLYAEERAARQEAESASRAKDEFLAMLGHELRNPLAAITTAAGLLSPGCDAQTTARAADVVTRQTRHLAAIVDDLLDVARVTTGKIILHRRPVDLGEVTRRCVEAARGAIATAGPTIHLDVQAAWVHADEVRLEQIITNLVTNAVKFTPPPGRIDVRVEPRDGAAELTVRDSGVGIPADMLPRIFDLFVQAEATLDRARGGLGLGLTLVQRLVLLHGGVVTARSDGPDRGSEFVVRLPRVEPPASAARETAGSRPSGARRVLVVEDNADAREMLRTLLELQGHEVVEAADGVAAVALAAEERFDVAVIDIGLPVMDGYEVARRLRTSGHDDMTLLAVTGYGQAEDRQRAHDAGFDAHVVKPVDAERLLRLLSETTGRGGRTGASPAR